MGGLWWVIKQWFTKLIKPSRLSGIICKIVYIHFCLLGVQFLVQFCVQFLKPQLNVQFRYLLPQLSLPQLLEDVVGKDTNECSKCYGDRSVADCKHVFYKFDMVFYIGEFDVVSGTN